MEEERELFLKPQIMKMRRKWRNSPSVTDVTFEYGKLTRSLQNNLFKLQKIHRKEWRRGRSYEEKGKSKFKKSRIQRQMRQQETSSTMTIKADITTGWELNGSSFSKKTVMRQISKERNHNKIPMKVCFSKLVSLVCQP